MTIQLHAIYRYPLIVMVPWYLDLNLMCFHPYPNITPSVHVVMVTPISLIYHTMSNITCCYHTIRCVVIVTPISSPPPQMRCHGRPPLPQHHLTRAEGEDGLLERHIGGCVGGASHGGHNETPPTHPFFSLVSRMGACRDRCTTRACA